MQAQENYRLLQKRIDQQRILRISVTLGELSLRLRNHLHEDANIYDNMIQLTDLITQDVRGLYVDGHGIKTVYKKLIPWSLLESFGATIKELWIDSPLEAGLQIKNNQLIETLSVVLGDEFFELILRLDTLSCINPSGPVDAKIAVRTLESLKVLLSNPVEPSPSCLEKNQEPVWYRTYKSIESALANTEANIHMYKKVFASIRDELPIAILEKASCLLYRSDFFKEHVEKKRQAEIPSKILSLISKAASVDMTESEAARCSLLYTALLIGELSIELRTGSYDKFEDPYADYFIALRNNLAHICDYTQRGQDILNNIGATEGGRLKNILEDIQILMKRYAIALEHAQYPLWAKVAESKETQAATPAEITDLLAAFLPTAPQKSEIHTIKVLKYELTQCSSRLNKMFFVQKTEIDSFLQDYASSSTKPKVWDDIHKTIDQDVAGALIRLEKTVKADKSVSLVDFYSKMELFLTKITNNSEGGYLKKYFDIKYTVDEKGEEKALVIEKSIKNDPNQDHEELNNAIQKDFKDLQSNLAKLVSLKFDSEACKNFEEDKIKIQKFLTDVRALFLDFQSNSIYKKSMSKACSHQVTQWLEPKKENGKTTFYFSQENNIESILEELNTSYINATKELVHLRQTEASEADSELDFYREFKLFLAKIMDDSEDGFLIKYFDILHPTDENTEEKGLFTEKGIKSDPNKEYNDKKNKGLKKNHNHLNKEVQDDFKKLQNMVDNLISFGSHTESCNNFEKNKDKIKLFLKNISPLMCDFSSDSFHKKSITETHSTKVAEWIEPKQERGEIVFHFSEKNNIENFLDKLNTNHMKAIKELPHLQKELSMTLPEQLRQAVAYLKDIPTLLEDKKSNALQDLEKIVSSCSSDLKTFKAVVAVKLMSIKSLSTVTEHEVREHLKLMVKLLALLQCMPKTFGYQHFYASLFIVTSIGQSIRMIHNSDPSNVLYKAVVQANDAGLIEEFEFLRWLRGSLAHAAEHMANIDEYGFELAYYANDLIFSPVYSEQAKTKSEFRPDLQHYLSALADRINKVLPYVSEQNSILAAEAEAVIQKLYEKMENNQLYRSYKKNDLLTTSVITKDRKLDLFLKEKDKIEKRVASKKILCLHEILDKMDEINNLKEKYSINIGVFGSLQRQDYMHDGDYSGLLVTGDRAEDLIAFKEIKKELIDILGFKIHIVNRAHLNAYCLALPEGNQGAADQLYARTQNHCTLSQLQAAHQLHSKLDKVESAEDINEIIKFIQENSIHYETTTAEKNPHYDQEVSYGNGPILHRLVEEASYKHNQEHVLLWLEAVSAAVAWGADINSKDRHGRTPLMSALYSEDTNVAKYLINNHNPDLFLSDEDNRSAFHYSITASSDTWSIFKIDSVDLVLLESLLPPIGHECRLGETYCTAIHFTIESDILQKAEVVALLINHQFDINAKDSKNGFSPIHVLTNKLVSINEKKKSSSQAIELEKNQLLNIFDILLSHHPVIEAVAYSNPLYRFIELGQPSLALKMLNSDNINTACIDLGKDSFEAGLRPIHVALRKYFDNTAQISYYNIVTKLIKLKCKLDVKGGTDRTPLQYAAQYCHKDLAQQLLAAGADPNYKNVLDTALYYDVEIAMLFIQSGAEITLDPETYLPLNLNVRKQGIITSGFETFISECTKLLKAIKNGDISQFRTAHQSINMLLQLKLVVGRWKGSLLDLAVKNERSDISFYLLERKYRFFKNHFNFLSTKSSLSFDILCWLIMRNELVWEKYDSTDLLEITELAVKYKGSNPIVLNELQRLNLLVISFEEEVLPEFEVYHKIYNAVKTKNLDILISELSSGGASLDAIYKNVFGGQSILHLAVQYKSDQVLEYLLTNSGTFDKIRNARSIELLDNEEKTPLHQAYLNRTPKIIDILIRHGANPNHVYASSYESILESIIDDYKYGEDEDDRNNIRQSVSLVLESENINVNETFNRTALRKAVSLKALPLVEVLIDYKGIDKDNPPWDSPIDIAIENDYYDIMKLLVNKGVLIYRHLELLLMHALKREDMDFIKVILSKSRVNYHAQISDSIGTVNKENFSKASCEIMHKALVTEAMEKVIPKIFYDKIKAFLNKELGIKLKKYSPNISSYSSNENSDSAGNLSNAFNKIRLADETNYSSIAAKDLKAERLQQTSVLGLYAVKNEPKLTSNGGLEHLILNEAKKRKSEDEVENDFLSAARKKLY